MTRALNAFALMFLSATTCPAETFTLLLTVSAGKCDRIQSPVRVVLSLPPTMAGAESAIVQPPNGALWPAQVTAPGLATEQQTVQATDVQRELHFILPGLKAGQSQTLKVNISNKPLTTGERFSWHEKPHEYEELRFGERPVLRYMCKPYDASTKENRDQTYKVYHHLYDPAGKRLVTKGPGGKYPHHRGLFYGFRLCEHNRGKADTWHCVRGAYQSHQKTLRKEAGPVLGRHLVEITWHGEDGKVFAKELREVTAYHVPGGQLVEFASQLRCTDGKVKLTGDPQHSGFQFRAANEVYEHTSQQTYFLRPDGPGKPDEVRNWTPREPGHANLPWNAMSFVLSNQRYTVAYLDKPTNPKPARYCERSYGRFGSDFEHELMEGKPLLVNYRIWLQEGEMKVEDVASRSADFTNPVGAVTRQSNSRSRG